MKNYVDGFDSPVFTIFNADGTKTRIEMSFEYQALTEYEEDVATLHRFTDGSKELNIHFYDYEWRLGYTDEINLTEDLIFPYTSSLKFAKFTLQKRNLI